METSELIKAMRCCGHNMMLHYCDKEDCQYYQYSYYDNLHRCNVRELGADAADALEAAEKRIADLEDDLRNGTISDPERFKIYNYNLKDLILFANMCKRNDVHDADLKQAAWNLELAVRAVMNERQEIVKNTLDEITMKFTPNFEEAYKEMMENCVLPYVKGEKNDC